VSRAWLKPFAFGAAAVSLASIGAWIFSNNAKASKMLIIEYAKSQGYGGPALPADPAPKFREPSEYVVWMARHCKLQDWQMHSDLVLDAPTTARLVVPWRGIFDASFNCLTQFIVPNRVTMKFTRT